MPEPDGAKDNRVAIEARGIVKAFGHGANALRALDDVSVSIRENEFFTLLGPSGCGKTTLLRLIAGFEYPTEGAILLYGEDIADPSALQAAGQHRVPELCAVSAPDGGGECRLRSADAWPAEERDRPRVSRQC